MASKVLPQALLVHPANHSIQCPPLLKQQKLGFSFDSSRRFSLSNSRSNSLSRASLNLTGLNLKPILRNSFVVRAEAEGGENAEVEAESAAVEESSENVEAVEESSENVEAAEEVSVAETETRPPRQHRVKLGDIMGILNKRAIEASEAVLPLPSIRTGDVVQLKLDNPAIRRRLSVYKGIVISRQNAGIHTTIRIRRIMSGVGVEIVFPLYSPMIKEIKVLSHRKVRKARLYYLRDKLPRFSTFK